MLSVYDSAQAVLAGYETTLNQRWRHEQREWRAEDMQFRNGVERPFMDLEIEFMNEQMQWRAEDMKQRVLDNARTLWLRHVEKNRREVEERTTELKGVSTTAGLIGGFAVTSFLNFGYADCHGSDDSGCDIPYAWDVIYGVSTAFVVALNVTAMMMCVLMHASVLKSAVTYVNEQAEADFILQCRDFANNYKVGARPPAPSRTFAAHWTQRCERGWQLAFYLFSAGTACMFVNLLAAAWIRYWALRSVAIILTVVLGIGVVAFAYVISIWSPHVLGPQPRAVAPSGAALGLPFDYHLPPRATTRRASQPLPTAEAAAEPPDEPSPAGTPSRQRYDGGGVSLDGVELQAAAAGTSAAPMAAVPSLNQLSATDGSGRHGSALLRTGFRSEGSAVLWHDAEEGSYSSTSSLSRSAVGSPATSRFR